MVLSFLLVYFGMRSYRDNAAGGQITFAKAFGVGIAITLISCLCYVVTWEIIYFNFMHNFMDDYNAHVIAKAKASGASPAAIQEQMQQLKRSKDLYENPLYNSALTFIEPFPVGLVITLISALIVKRKAPSAAPPALTVPCS
jgi:Na+/glutamate symporter